MNILELLIIPCGILFGFGCLFLFTWIDYKVRNYKHNKWWANQNTPEKIRNRKLYLAKWREDRSGMITNVKSKYNDDVDIPMASVIKF